MFEKYNYQRKSYGARLGNITITVKVTEHVWET